MEAGYSARLLKEEHIVAELSLLGVTYISRLVDIKVAQPRECQVLLADLVRQPSSRVRTAIIALLLERPEFAMHLPSAVSRLRADNRLTLKLLYTAAVILQHRYATEIQELQGERFGWLPDLYSAELGLPENLTAEQRLKELGSIHLALTGSKMNWTGTYENAARHWLRRKKLEAIWNLSASAFPN